MILKGWCRFRCPEKSLTREEVRELGDRVVRLLDPPTRLLVSVLDPLLQNSRLVLRVANGGGYPLCMQIMRQIQDALAATPIVVHCSPIFCTVEPSPEHRARNSVIARACAALETFIPEGQSGHYRLDVRAGTAYYASCPNSEPASSRSVRTRLRVRTGRGETQLSRRAGQ